MLIDGLNLLLVSDDFDEDVAEKDSEEKFFFKNEDECGISFYHKSKTDSNIVYAFHCEPEPNVWCVLVQKYKIQ